MNTYRAIIQPSLDAVKESGPERLEDGVLLVGNAPQITSMAVQHKIYKPLSDSEIDLLEGKIGAIHPDLKRFYKEMNGLNLFVKTFCMFGVKSHNPVVGEVYALEPFDVVIKNVEERPALLSGGWTVVGGYADGGDYLVMDSLSGRVDRVSSDCSRMRVSWENLQAVLEQEGARLTQEYYQSGGNFPKKLPWRKYQKDKEALYDEVFGNYICVVCGFDGLDEPPYQKGIINCGLASYEICSSCGFQTGYADYSETESEEVLINQYRQNWIKGGMKWDSEDIGIVARPANWNPKKQLRNIGIVIE